MNKNYFLIWLAVTVGVLMVAPTILLVALKSTVCPGMSWVWATAPLWGVLVCAALLIAGGIITAAIGIMKANVVKKNNGGDTDEE